MTIPRVNPGDPIPRQAETINAFIDAANAHKLSQQVGGSALQFARGHNVIRVKNATGSTLPHLGIVRFSDGIFTATSNLGAWKANTPAVEVLAPTNETQYHFGVLLEPLAIDGIGACLVSGAAHVKIDVTDDTHTHAYAVAGETGHLQSGTEGAPIIAKGSGTGEVWAYVLLGPMGGREIQLFELQDDIEQGGSAAMAWRISMTGIEEWDRLGDPVEVNPARHFAGVLFGTQGDDSGNIGDIVAAINDGGNWHAIGAGFLIAAGITADGTYSTQSWGDLTPAGTATATLPQGDGSVVTTRTISLDIYTPAQGTVSGEKYIAAWEGGRWIILPGTPEYGCHLELVDDAEDPEDGKVRVTVDTLAGDGLDVDESGNCARLTIMADCGIIVSANGVGFDAANAAGDGLTGDGCTISVQAGCGIAVDANGVNLDLTVTPPLVQTSCGNITLTPGYVEGGCGIDVATSEDFLTLTISANRTELIGANGGLTVVGNDCGIGVDVGCGLTITEAGQVTIDREAIVGDGLVSGASNNCQIDVLTGCGIEIDVMGAVSVNPDDIAGNGLTEIDEGGCKKLQVSTGCGLVFGESGQLQVDLRDLIDGETITATNVDGCYVISAEAAEPCPDQCECPPDVLTAHLEHVYGLCDCMDGLTVELTLDEMTGEWSGTLESACMISSIEFVVGRDGVGWTVDAIDEDTDGWTAVTGITYQCSPLLITATLNILSAGGTEYICDETGDYAEFTVRIVGIPVLPAPAGGGGGAPAAHASTHATGGSDPLTPADIGAATAAQGTLADSAVQPGDLATVATSGAYSDLSGTPSLATVATSGSYADLSGTPTLATVATSGAYADLTGQPMLASVATSGAYSDLTGAPSLATVATSGAYADLTGQPSLATVATSGAYTDLSGTPTLGGAASLNVGTTAGTVAAGDDSRLSDARTPTSHTHPAADISDASANGRSLITAADYSAMRTLLTLVPGTDVQAYDAELAALAGLTSAADKLPYFTGSGSAALTDLTSQSRTLLALSTLATWRSTLLVRELLFADRSYYVRTDGSDSNDGLANTSGGAFLTIQKAIDVACSLDNGIYNVTINVAAGTYTTNLTLKTIVGAGYVRILGDTTTPSNVVIAGGSSTCVTANAAHGNWQIHGVKLTGTGIGFDISFGSVLKFNAVDFGNSGAMQISAQSQGTVQATGNYSITSSATRHIWAQAKSYVLTQGRTVTLTGTPAFAGQFATCSDVSLLLCASMTFSGSATGTRYLVTGNGVINTGGGGASYFPGNAAGSTSTGGQYL